MLVYFLTLFSHHWLVVGGEIGVVFHLITITRGELYTVDKRHSLAIVKRLWGGRRSTHNIFTPKGQDSKIQDLGYTKIIPSHPNASF